MGPKIMWASTHPYRVVTRAVAMAGPRVLMNTKGNNPLAIIDELVDLAQVARKNGLLALEERGNQQEDPFFKQCIMLIVDNNQHDHYCTSNTDYICNVHILQPPFYSRREKLSLTRAHLKPVQPAAPSQRPSNAPRALQRLSVTVTIR